MKLSIVTFATLLSAAAGFAPASSSVAVSTRATAASSALDMSTVVDAAPFAKGPRYVPYCVFFIGFIL